MSSQAPRKLVSAFVGTMLILLAVVGPASGSTTSGNAAIPTLDEAFLEASQSIDGFGGAFIDDEDRLSVWIKQGAEKVSTKRVKQLLADILDDSTLRARDVHFLTAKYDFAKLKSWIDIATPKLLAMSGIISTDIDERMNRLVIGIEDVALEAAVRDAVDELRIPQEAVQVQQVNRVVLESSLRDAHRPLVGGLEIARYTSDGVYARCTLGFPAISSRIQGLVTNSHCSSQQYWPDRVKTRWGQPLSTSVLTDVMEEAIDPEYFTGGSCPSGRYCRHADALFALRINLTPVEQGSIADPSPILRSYDWDGVSKYKIVAARNPMVGETVVKVGKTTGQTSGVVSNGCVNISVSGTSMTLLCQAQASYSSSSGDSGSPVFRIISSGSGTVALVGIHWGSGGSHSPFANIEKDLGNLDVCTSGYSC